METTYSQDGTPIAFERSGSGPALILVDGALCYRAQGPSRTLAAALADRFTVYRYDRRGRGDSGNRTAYAVEREVEDIDALIREAGGTAHVFGLSSGAALALEAAHRGLSIQKLGLYEAPFIVDDTHPPLPGDFIARLERAVAAGRPGDAVKQFMKLVGVPGPFILLMRLLPMWSKLTSVAHTIAYDLRIIEAHQQGRPFSPAAWANARMPTLVMDGGKSPAWMRNAMRALSGVLPNATYRTLDRQTHMVKAGVVGPELVQFFNA